MKSLHENLCKVMAERGHMALLSAIITNTIIINSIIMIFNLESSGPGIIGDQ